MKTPPPATEASARPYDLGKARYEAFVANAPAPDEFPSWEAISNGERQAWINDATHPAMYIEQDPGPAAAVGGGLHSPEYEAGFKAGMTFQKEQFAPAGSGDLSRLVRVGDLPAPITNPEAWPPGYADGFNDYARLIDQTVSTVSPPAGGFVVDALIRDNENTRRVLDWLDVGHQDTLRSGESWSMFGKAAELIRGTISPTAQPSAKDGAEFPECSGTPNDCPENEGHGCCNAKDASEDSRESRMVVVERNAEGKPTVWCDPEIVDLVTALNAGGIPTVASCSGHGVNVGNIALRDGRELLIAPDFASARRLEATTASGLVDDAMVERAMKAGQEYWDSPDQVASCNECDGTGKVPSGDSQDWCGACDGGVINTGTEEGAMHAALTSAGVINWSNAVVHGWRLVEGIKVFSITPPSGMLPPQEFVRYDAHLAATQPPAGKEEAALGREESK